MTRKTLEELGLTKEVIDQIMTENGNDIESARKSEQAKFETERTQLNERITDLQGQITSRDSDLAALNESLTAAKADAGRLAEVQTALTDLQAKYDADKQEWSAKTQKQAYEFAVKTEAGSLKFSSDAARRDFIRGAIEKDFKMEDGKIIGFSDYVTSYRTADPGAFAEENAEGEEGSEAPTIVLPTGKTPSPEKSAFNFQFTGVRPVKE